MKFFKFIKRLIFVPKCASCNECLSPFVNAKLKEHGTVCFCEKCYKEWHEEASVICNTCALPAHMCTCTPKLLSKFYSTIPSLCFYDTDSKKIQNKIIFSVKRLRNSELLTFLSFELYPKIAKIVDSKGVSRSDIVFTWIPRKSASVAKYGFDQGKELCKSISKLFGANYLPLFLRIGGKEQKDLDSAGRITNLDRSVILNHNLIGFPNKIKDNDISNVLKGKTVIIIDDIITTGATVRHGIDLLADVTDSEVLTACIARVDEKKRK